MTKSKFTLPKLLLFGDSITQLSFSQIDGFSISPALATDYQRKLDLVVRGFRGYTSRAAKHVAPVVFDTLSDVKLLVLFFGTNDASQLPELHVEIDEYRNNITSIVEQAKAKNIKIVLVSPATVNENTIMKEHDGKVADLKTYADAAIQLAKELKVPIIPLWYLFAEHAGWKDGETLPGTKGTSNSKVDELFEDGLHFSGKGYKIYYDALKKTIKENYPELDSDNLEDIFPDYAEANTKPEVVFKEA